MARIAEHFKNIQADPRASLLVFEPPGKGQRIQTQPRLTLNGTIEQIEEDAQVEAWARYLDNVPSAKEYEFTHAFALFRLIPSTLRYIGGFAAAYWFEPEVILFPADADPMKSRAQGVVEHMNDDHVDAIQLLFEVHASCSPKSVKMLDVDSWGMLFESEGPDQKLWISFPEPTAPDNIRTAVVSIVKQAKILQAENKDQ